MDEQSLRELCTKYVNLTEEEITEILTMARLLPAIADIEEADVFIDCLMTGGDSLVVAEAKPTKVPSAYKGSVVGMVATKENEPAVARTFRLGVGTRQMKATTQEQGITIQTVEPITTNGRVIGVLIREKRTSEEIQPSEKLHLSMSGYEAIAEAITKIRPGNNWLAECIDEALLLVDNDGIISFRNRVAKKMYEELGYVDDIQDQPYANVRLTDESADLDEHDYSYEEALVGSRIISVKTVPVESGEYSKAVLMQDITKLKEQEKELVLKKTAIREMHHRVKNSLQTIVSLLNLQTRKSDNDEVREVLTETMNRILSIANTHELLASEVSDDVSLREVLGNLKNNITRAFSGSRKITITVDGDDFKVDSDLATSVSLVVNELIQNAVKYAFPDREEGHIGIHVRHGDFYSELTVEDNGVGYDAADRSREHLGMSIVRSMVRDKLRGEIRISSDSSGTRIWFSCLNRIMKPIDT
jgi:two-component sensor histidine kinase/PAS domain-containing protein